MNGMYEITPLTYRQFCIVYKFVHFFYFYGVFFFQLCSLSSYEKLMLKYNTHLLKEWLVSQHYVEYINKKQKATPLNSLKHRTFYTQILPFNLLKH